VVAGGTDTGTFLAFVGGWFKFKLGYPNANHTIRKDSNTYGLQFPQRE
jgi:hypothetical protein